MTRFTRLAAAANAPVLIRQARRLRRDTPRLPDAAGPWSGTLAGARPIRLLVLGDSTAAGVGASTQSEALPGRLAHGLAERYARGCDWVAVGENGATARDVLERFVPEVVGPSLARFDLILLTIGANDALGLRSRRAFSRDVRDIVDALLTAHPRAIVLVSLMPRFDLFELLPDPLRDALARHARSLDEGARLAIGCRDRVIDIPPTPGYSKGFFASDEFHPSAQGYREWADYVLECAGRLDLTG